MRLYSLFITGLFLSVCSGSAMGQTNDDPPAARRAEVARQYGLDPTSALESRVQATPATVLKMFEELGGPAPTPHTLTEGERRQLAEAFAALPPLHRRILSERLRSVSFLDAMPNTALTSTVNPSEDLAEYVAVYHWTHVLKQPFRIVLRKEGKKIFVYEPMRSKLVRSRINQMKRFYAKEQATRV